MQVFDALQRQVVTNLAVAGDRPKALAVSPDGARVYVAIFESGNASTILASGGVITDPSGPYGGQNPPPNEGPNLDPPLYRQPEAVDLSFPYEAQLPDSIIVKRNAAGRWMDGNTGDWTEFVSGTNASRYGRTPGWDMPDRDLAIIDTSTFGITYATGLMNICMAMAVNPVSGKVAVVGTDGINERRFEPKLRGIFIRVNLAMVDPVTLGKTIVDLNPHLDYSTPAVPQSIRDLSLGDPRGIVWNAAGTRAYVTGMGSRNMVVIDAQGSRAVPQPVELGEGPTGLVLDEARHRMFVLNRFSATLSVLDTLTLTVLTNIALFDPTPMAIKSGRKHLYDTRRNSGLGQASCGSCHVDARFDRLAWDLSNPAAPTIIEDAYNRTFHPIKGPLVTQTLQDVLATNLPIIGLHWRGERLGLEKFNPTFTDLLGSDRQLSGAEMQEFKDFLATIYFPPNRFRNFDNSLPADLPLPGFFGVGAGDQLDSTPLPNGNAVRGREIFNGRGTCTTCHRFPSGLGFFEGDEPLSPRGEGGRVFKVAQLRSFADKVGMDRTSTSSRAGFGFGFNGSADSLPRFLFSRSLLDDPEVQGNQVLADLTAFLLAFTGTGSQGSPFNTQDAPAAVGRQLSLASPQPPALLNQMFALAESPANRVDLVARGVDDGLKRGWFYDRTTGRFQSDRNGEQFPVNDLLALAAPGAELTFTIVPLGSGRRLAVDRDDDLYFDLTEIENGFDPLDPLSHAISISPRLEVDPPLPAGPIRIHPGMSVTRRFSAADPDSPPQTVTLSLTRDIPAGSSFDPQTGVFTWIPSVGQGDRVWRIGVRATDNGELPLSDSAVFEIAVVLPLLKNVVVTMETNAVTSEALLQAAISFDTLANLTYRLESKERLDDPEWLERGSWTGNESEFRVFDQSYLPAPRRRFYRLQILQNP